MAKRRKPRCEPQQPTSDRRQSLGIVAVTLLALALVGIGTLHTQRLWTKLAYPAFVALDRDEVNDAFKAARSAGKPNAIESLILTLNSRQFTAAYQNPDLIPAAIDRVRGYLPALRHTQVGRLQLAAIVMLGLERDDLPREQWWPRLAPYLTGLDTAPFDHFMPDLIADDAATYRRLGLAPGAALRTATGAQGYPHGPFLEYFSAQLELVAATHTAAGDDTTAGRCRLLTRRLLRQWVRDPGPPTLRLLAGQLLADILERDEAPENDTLVRELRAWRAAGRREMIACPPPPPLLGLSHDPEVCTAEATTLLRRLALTTWLLGAGVGLSLGLLVMAAVLVIRRARMPSLGVWAVPAIAITALIVVCGLVWPIILPGNVEADFRRSTTDELGWPLHPFVSGVAGLAISAALAAFWPTRQTGTRLARIGATTAGAGLLLAIAMLGAGLLARSAVSRYDTCVATRLAQVWETTHAPAETAHLVDVLRNWSPR